MRRALTGLVPVEILARRRKAYIEHGPFVALRGAQEQIEAIILDSMAAEIGLIDRDALLVHFHRIVSGQDVEHFFPLINAILFELWLSQSMNRQPHPEIGAIAEDSARNRIPAEYTVHTDSNLFVRSIPNETRT
jgi:hypothetical protein